MIEPKLRFKADDGSEFPDWEKKKISEIFSKVKDKNKDGQNQNVITNSAEFGLINQRDFFDKDIAVDGKTENYTVIKTGDFVYNPRKSKQAPYGPFNCYHLKEDGIVSPLYTCLRPNGNADDKYLHWYFQSGSWYRFIYENGAQNGARHDRVGMTDSLMQEIPVYLPQALEEQQKIAEFLSTIDTVIEKQKETVSTWEERKKGVMQKLFSQEVRFKADDGSDFPDWEEKKLGDVCKTFSGGTPKSGEARYYENGTISFIRSGEIHDDKTELRITNDGLNESSAKMVDIGDILYALYGATSGEVDISKIKGAINQAILCIRPLNDFNRKFIVEILRHNKETILQTYLQGGQGNLSAQIIQSLVFDFPCLAEQQKIADCLLSLDEVIEKQKATLAAWEELKKGLLQQMFV